jgi:hypothetical protein
MEGDWERETEREGDWGGRVKERERRGVRSEGVKVLLCDELEEKDKKTICFRMG